MSVQLTGIIVLAFCCSNFTGKLSLVVGIELIVLLGYAGYTVQVITDINGTTLAYDDEWSQDQQYFF